MPTGSSVAFPDYPRALGTYVLLRPLARGGMGDVILARHDGAAGIKKFCVVKSLRSHLLGDPEYIRRFVEEARVVVQLSHRNICPVFDVGRVGESTFLVMEHIVGFDLGTTRERADVMGTPLARAMALHIVGEALEALDYAHRHVDPLTGRSLGLVHRDVSPHNVMINSEGEVKLIDFGLAATDTQLNEEAGSNVVMGKLAYMAPEHARGEIIDGRADQFAAAVVLYELLTGSRYYADMTMQEVWGVAGTGRYVAPRLSELPEHLQSILKKALAPTSTDRFDTCSDFREALASYAYDHHLRVTTRDVREVMERLFKEELAGVREMLLELANVVPESVDADAASFETLATTVHGLAPTEPTELVTRPSLVVDTPTTTVLRAAALEPPRPKSPAPLVAGAALGLALVVGAIWVATTPDDGVHAVPLHDGHVDAPSSTGKTDPAVEPATPKPPPRPVERARPPDPPRDRDPPRPRPKPPPTTTRKTIPDSYLGQIDFLKTCNDPCARKALQRHKGFLDMEKDALQAHKDDVGRCAKACAR